MSKKSRKFNIKDLSRTEISQVEMPQKVKEVEREMTEEQKEEYEKAKNGYFSVEKIGVMLNDLIKRRDNQKCKGEIRKKGERVYCHKN